MKKIYTIIFSLLLIQSAVWAQQKDLEPLECRADKTVEAYYKANPKAKKDAEELKKFTADYSKKLKSGTVKATADYVIPVVFHVFGTNFNGKSVNDALIIDALERTNEDFQGLTPDWNSVISEFNGVKKILNIEFKLAQIDPDGNPTTGVTYNSDREGFGNIGTSVENEIRDYAWDNYKYMNVYIQSDLYNDGVTNNSGVAWYPYVWMSDDNVARVVYNGAYIGNNTDENFRSILTHEFGHYLNLIHTFQDGCPDSGGCSSSGDEICDTPPADHSHLDGDRNCEGDITNWENFMDYTINYSMFTYDQVARMESALHYTTRSSLWSESNLIATGCQDSPVIANMSADTDFLFPGEGAIFHDESTTTSGSLNSWVWSFPGGLPNSYSGKTPPPIVYNNYGKYDVTITVKNTNGDSHTVTKTDMIIVSDDVVMRNGSLTLESGIFYDSQRNINYTNDEYKTLTIYPKDNTKKLQFFFVKFAMEADDNNCNYDYLEIYDGSSTSASKIGTYCNTTSPNTITATNSGGALTFRFISDDNTTGSGWKAYFEYSDANRYIMGNGSETVSTGTFYDSGQFYNYSNDENKTMTFYPEDNTQKLEFEFLEFFMEEDGTTCEFDYLEVYDGNSTSATKIGTYCHLYFPGAIRATNSQGALTFRFISDDNTTASGWRAKIGYIDPNEFVMTDGLTVTTSQGVFFDSGKNVGYNNDESKVMTFLSGKEGKKLQFEFTEFALEVYGTACNYDYLEIFDGPSTSSYLIGRFCHLNPPEKIVATNSEGSLTFKFITDDNTPGQGWRADISCVEGGGSYDYTMQNTTIRTSHGVFYDSGRNGDYSNDEYKTMTFYPEDNTKKLRFNFSEFGMETDDTGCEFDYLEVFDGSSTSASKIGTYCRTTSPGTITATNSQGALTFRFTSDDNTAELGWKAYFEYSDILKYPMKNGSETVSTGVFFDSGIYNDYSNDENNTMTFYPEDSNEKLYFEFVEFLLEDYGTTCTYDYLEIFDGSSTSATKIGTYCNFNIPGAIRATNSQGALTFRFTSDDNTPAPGWMAKISYVDPNEFPLKIENWIEGTSHTASAGSNRLLLVTAHVEHDQPGISLSSLKYGGVAMTKVEDVNGGGTGYQAFTAIYILKESGIASASGNTIVPTWSTTPNRDPAFSSVFLSGVNQTDPIGAKASNGVDGDDAVSTSSLATTDGDLVIVAATSGVTGSYILNNDFTEEIEFSPESADAVVGYKSARGVDETPSASQSGSTRQSIIGVVVQKSTDNPDITKYTLTINVVGNGSVSPTSGPYEEGSKVQLTATPAVGFQFVSWSGDANGSSNTVVVTINADKNVTATFVPVTCTTVTLTLTLDDYPDETSWDFKDASGAVVLSGGTYSGENGAVKVENICLDDGCYDFNMYDSYGDGLSDAPEGDYEVRDASGKLLASMSTPDFDYEETTNFCLSNITKYTLTTSVVGSGSISPAGGSYTEGTEVEMLAIPAPGYQFAGWSGDLQGTANPAQLIMNANKSVTANFSYNPISFTLSINEVGTGRVTSSPSGGIYDAGTAVVLTASPAAGNIFVGWSGALNGTTNPVILIMDDNKLVTATFSATQAQYRLATYVSGGGSVTPGGIYNAGEVVAITATPNVGYKFDGWSGDLIGSINPESIIMNNDMSVTANFSVIVQSPVYCDATGNASTYEHITRVQFGSINKSSVRQGYADHTSSSTTLSVGVATTLSITTVDNYSKDQMKVYIDYNNDGDFTDSGEEVYHETDASTVKTYTTNITAPSSALLNMSLRMRIVLWDASYTTPIPPCGTFSYGEVEDYTVNIVSGASGPIAKAGIEVSANPNPSDGNFVIKVGSELIGSVAVNVYNMRGQLVAQKKAEKATETIEIPMNLHLVPATYNVQVILNDNNWVSRIVIQ